MKVLLQSRANLFQKPGGDTVQILNIKAGGEKTGIEYSISLELQPELGEYDLVHIFNITRVQESYLQLTNARRQGVKVCCSPIYQDLRKYNREGREGLGNIIFRLCGNEKYFEVLRIFFQVLHRQTPIAALFSQLQSGYWGQQKTVLREADGLLFNSLLEKKAVYIDIVDGSSPARDFVLPPAVESKFYHAEKSLFEEKYGLRDFLLCVGRIEDLKNQLNLIQAWRGMDIPLVFIGKINRAHRWYGKQFLSQIGREERVHYFSELPEDDYSSAFAAARVHLLPSWFENMGLVSLEAGLAGCNIVTTENGYLREYAKDLVWYCDPSSIDSIREAIKKAYYSPVNSDLREQIYENYTWDVVGPRLAEIYREIL